MTTMLLRGTFCPLLRILLHPTLYFLMRKNGPTWLRLMIHFHNVTTVWR